MGPTQAKLRLKAKLGWLDCELQASTAAGTGTAVLFDPGALKSDQRLPRQLVMLYLVCGTPAQPQAPCPISLGFKS